MGIFVSDLDFSLTETELMKNESIDFCLPELFHIPASGVGGRILQVKKLEQIECLEVKKMIEIWKRIALEKVQLSKNLDEKARFYDCESTLSLLSYGISGKDPCYETYICHDDLGNLQGLMGIQDLSKDCLKITSLATHPHNIRSFPNGVGDGKVRGAGTALVKMAEQIARERKKDRITLYSLSSSEGFYKKCGFSIEDATFLEMFKPIEKGEK